MTIWRTSFSAWIPKATNTHSETCNIYCFFHCNTVRTSPSITLYVHRLCSQFLVNLPSRNVSRLLNDALDTPIIFMLNLLPLPLAYCADSCPPIRMRMQITSTNFFFFLNTSLHFRTYVSHVRRKTNIHGPMFSANLISLRATIFIFEVLL